MKEFRTVTYNMDVRFLSQLAGAIKRICGSHLPKVPVQATAPGFRSDLSSNAIPVSADQFLEPFNVR